MQARLFHCEAVSDRVRLFSYRDDVALRVSDVESALQEIRRDRRVFNGTGEGSVEEDVRNLFDRIVGGWDVLTPESLFSLDASSVDHPVTHALQKALTEPREVFVPNIAAFRAIGNTSPITVYVGTSYEDLPNTNLLFPIILSGEGAIVGPLVNRGRPCASCMMRTFDLHRMQCDPVSRRYDPELFVSRILDSMLVKAHILYFDSYVAFASALDETPIRNAALRFPACESCDVNFQKYAKRLAKDESQRARAALRRRGVLK